MGINNKICTMGMHSDTSEARSRDAHQLQKVSDVRSEHLDGERAEAVDREIEQVRAVMMPK
eukprot:7799190-Pyramimonas_sp.AAC.1